MSPDELERLIDEYLTLLEHQEKIEAELEAIKDQLRTLELGKYPTKAGTVIISPPHRKLDLERAASALPPDVRESCYVRTLDRERVLKMIGPVIKDWAMDAGNGRPVIKVIG